MEYATTRRQFDHEYATEWRRERDWLKERGFTPTFIRILPGGIERYKYRKTEKLFDALAEFYREVDAERSWKAAERKMSGAAVTKKLSLKDLVKMGHVTISAEDLREILADIEDGDNDGDNAVVGTPLLPEDDTI